MRSRARRFTFARALGAAASFAMMFVLPAMPAAAAVTSTFAAGTLTITGDAAADVVVIRCSDEGRVRINRVSPDSGGVHCVDVATIAVSVGDGDDVVDLSRVRTADFAAVTTVTIDGGGGRDRLEGSELHDTITGGEGDDLLTAAIEDTVDGGDGTDRGHIFLAGDVTISDTTFPTLEILQLSASDADDRIDASAFTGKLSVVGRGGDDILIGGSGSNRLGGADGDDTLIGGPANDWLSGASGTDTSTGGAGNDRFESSESVDMGPGNDRVSVFAGFGSTLDIVGGPGKDRLTASVLGRIIVSDDAVRSDPGGRTTVSSIERASFTIFDYSESRLMIDASAFTGALALMGGPLNDRLIGGSSNDLIAGDLGDDRLVGGPGRDRIDGSRGHDVCDGGPGRDRTIDCEEV